MILFQINKLNFRTIYNYTVFNFTEKINISKKTVKKTGKYLNYDKLCS